jgi:5-methylthioadenosine/S-adenosylhomocysteine deaminase
MSFDVVISGATLLTGDPTRPAIPDRVIALVGARIAFVGTRAEAPTLDASLQMELPGRVVTPGFVNVHTHAILSLMRGVALDLGFAPAYTRGVPHGHEIGVDDAVALARLGALEALTFGSTTIADSYVHAEATLPAMADIGLRIWTRSRFHDVDFSRVHQGIWRHDRECRPRSRGCATSSGEALERRTGSLK